MAAVMTVKIGRHTVTFHDDAYINCSAEEIEQRKQQARIVADGIYARAALREKAERSYTDEKI